jgi:GDP-4-dehydro-6-deoxy-D-mannose reductase
VTRFLVTGASGFVGPHLRAALDAAGHDVWTTDRGEAGPPGAAGPGAEARHRACDLMDAAAVRALVEEARPDGVFHLAGLSSVAYSFAHPQEVLRVNLVSACNVLEALRAAAPRARLLAVGSAEQYGAVPPEAQPIPETHPFRPTSPYAVSKVAQEILALQYAEAHGLEVVATRSFNHSGPGQSDRFVLPSLARQIAAAERDAGEARLRVGNLEVRRDFLDVRDVVQAYLLLMQRGEPSRAYNVCRGEAYRLRDLLDLLVGRARVGVRVEVDPERLRAADLPVLRGDPGRLRARTGWEPRLGIEAMLGDVLDDWRRRLGSGDAR